MIPTPQFPSDFKVLTADGGASYWWWSPDTGPEYDGTWPVGEPQPNGLMIGGSETAQAEWADEDDVVVTWVWGDEDGPYRSIQPRDGRVESDQVNFAISQVMGEVVQEMEAAK